MVSRFKHNQSMKYQNVKLRPLITHAKSARLTISKLLWSLCLVTQGDANMKVLNLSNYKTSHSKFTQSPQTMQFHPWHLDTLRHRPFKELSKNIKHFKIGLSMHAQSTDEVSKWETSSTNNSCQKSPINNRQTILESKLNYPWLGQHQSTKFHQTKNCISQILTFDSYNALSSVTSRHTTT